MTIRIAINGFGRIGRMVVRAANKNQNVEIAIYTVVACTNQTYTKQNQTKHTNKVIRFVENWKTNSNPICGLLT